MSQGKKGLLPSLEIIIISVFFLSFIIWAVSKCSATQDAYQSDPSLGDNQDDVNTDSIYFGMPKPLPPKIDSTIITTSPTTITTSGTSVNSNEPVRTKVVSRLYVTIDGLKLRTGPSLDSTVVDRLKLFDEVYFTGNYTDSTMQLSLGKVMADEPWIEVQNKKGKVGWVYGAGVDYKKKKRAGVQ